MNKFLFAIAVIALAVTSAQADESPALPDFTMTDHVFFNVVTELGAQVTEPETAIFAVEAAPFNATDDECLFPAPVKTENTASAVVECVKKGSTRSIRMITSVNYAVNAELVSPVEGWCSQTQVTATNSRVTTTKSCTIQGKAVDITTVLTKAPEPLVEKSTN